jgi:hypothetical protein
MNPALGALAREREPGDLELTRDGAQRLPGLARSVIAELMEALCRWPEGRAGVRISGDPAVARLIGPNGDIGRAISSIVGERARPVRAVLFDKNDKAAWALGWHQDRTIAVRARVDAVEFGPWSIKQGIVHVEPPFAVIAAMHTLRIHIDPVDDGNAPLLIAAGSHRIGRVPAARAAELAAGFPVHACLAEAGRLDLSHAHPARLRCRTARPTAAGAAGGLHRAGLASRAGVARHLTSAIRKTRPCTRLRKIAQSTAS